MLLGRMINRATHDLNLTTSEATSTRRSTACNALSVLNLAACPSWHDDNLDSSCSNLQVGGVSAWLFSHDNSLQAMPGSCTEPCVHPATSQLAEHLRVWRALDIEQQHQRAHCVTHSAQDIENTRASTALQQLLRGLASSHQQQYTRTSLTAAPWLRSTILNAVHGGMRERTLRHSLLLQKWQHASDFRVKSLAARAPSCWIPSLSKIQSSLPRNGCAAGREPAAQCRTCGASGAPHAWAAAACCMPVLWWCIACMAHNRRRLQWVSGKNSTEQPA